MPSINNYWSMMHRAQDAHWRAMVGKISLAYNHSILYLSVKLELIYRAIGFLLIN